MSYKSTVPPGVENGSGEQLPAGDHSQDEIAELKARLAEAEDILRAIRAGEVDALLISPAHGDDRIYTISSADRLYRLMIEQMREGALVVSASGDTVLYCNRCFADMLHLPMEHILGRSLHPYLEATSLIRFDDLLRGDVGKAEFDLITANNRRVPVAVSANPVEGDDGTPICSLLIADLTDQRDNERLRRAEQALRAADRRKDEFLAMLGHELRNPLAPIRMAVELIRCEAAEHGSKNLHNGLDIIDRQVKQMTRLVDDLLDVARITRGTVKLQKEVVPLRDVVAIAVESIRPLSERHHHLLKVHIPSQPVCVNVDAARMAEVITNLLHNAVKYTRDGGQIDLVVRVRDELAEVVVRDTGVGIPTELLPHVFELFTQAEVTLDRSEGGLGLGLTLVKRLVEMHGGTVSAKSRGPGTGSEFTILLPVVDKVVGYGRKDRRCMGRLARSSKRIMVVDDNVDAAEMLGFLLQNRGHQVEIVHDGVTALQRLAEFKPDVLCLDIGLPQMDGYEVAARIRAHELGKTVTLIAVTGYGQEQDRARAVNAGFDHHLVKPIEPDMVYRLIE